MPGQMSTEGDEPLDGQPAPYDPDTEPWLQWEERLEAADYSPLPTFYVSDIYSHVSKIALNKARRNLPEGYVLEYDENWPNIIEPHREDRICFHITSLEGGILFPLRPLLVELCHYFRILPGQITPNAHRLLNSFVNICTHLRIDPTLRLFLFMFEVRPGKSGCEGFVYFKGRNNRKFISDLPQSNHLWKEKFLFIKFPSSVTLLSGLKWSDNVLKHEFTEPATAPDLEESLEKLLRGDPFTGKMYHYGSWAGASNRVARVPPRPMKRGTGYPPRETLRRLEARVTQTSFAKTIPVRQETVEVHSEDEYPLTGEAGQTGTTTANPPPKGKGKTRSKKVASTHPSAKRKRGENAPGTESLEELWVKMTLKLKEMGEVGPDALEQLSDGSPSRSSKLEEKLKRAEAHNRELQGLTSRQLDEVANLSRMAGEAEVEILRLKEENLKLMEDMELKEREFPVKAKQWMENNLVEAARVLTSSEERTMEGFKLLYREEQGKDMITGRPRMRSWLNAIKTSMLNYMAWPLFQMKSLHLPSLSSKLLGCARLLYFVKL
ncbi:unnamed protein product [Cuscuta campestris]|uniref:Transposase (putative) gypsy type domain-containing protein n=1 Tax=Cuscuta campestris TaxID=132261 RepID=A0A484MET6_9ASTE|nr:unnamed protein product [Cuscuta campestris]